MSTIQSRQVTPAELRRNSEAIRSASPKDNLIWLETERDLEVAAREEAFGVNDMLTANRHAKRADHLAETALELKRLREITGHMTTALRSRIIVEVVKEKTEWKPTHRHYKGTLYRVTGTRSNSEGEELVEGIDYDDEKGNRYFLPRERFESHLDSGRPRYQILYPEEDR